MSSRGLRGRNTRTRVIHLEDGSVGWFHGGSRPNKQPGMSYASMKRWLLLSARMRPPIGGDGQPIWKGK